MLPGNSVARWLGRVLRRLEQFAHNIHRTALGSGTRLSVGMDCHPWAHSLYKAATVCAAQAELQTRRVLRRGPALPSQRQFTWLLEADCAVLIFNVLSVTAWQGRSCGQYPATQEAASGCKHCERHLPCRICTDTYSMTQQAPCALTDSSMRLRKCLNNRAATECHGLIRPREECAKPQPPSSRLFCLLIIHQGLRLKWWHRAIIPQKLKKRTLVAWNFCSTLRMANWGSLQMSSTLWVTLCLLL